MTSIKDSLYSQPLGQISSFAFDDHVANVFPDMISRSVPGYQTMIAAIGLLAGRFATEGSVCYDLGCSLGAASFSMRQNITAQHCKIIAVDNSPAMLSRFEIVLTQTETPIELHCADIRNVKIENASIVVLNFTLQFLPVEDREKLLANIYDGLLPNGALIISEKLAFDDARQHELQIDLHHEFKKSQGYSDLEISQKRTALENVLIPETFATHQNRLKSVGFNSAELWFQYFNFASFIALK
ncbi:MAG: carboxy-S-adenosyl-L-methionine synthase CmoA [Methylococcales bacterium]|nr:carboxy-S-adenosyl-L-methionine synthase CmoA [Methylococcales bacterium]